MALGGKSMVFVSSLASGSSGNAFLLSDGKQSLLVDAGISAKQIVQRMAELGQDPASLHGIFITHEHSDHIQGVAQMVKRYGIPVYITRGTHQNCNLDLEKVEYIKHNDVISVGTLQVKAFGKQHDTPEPVSFSIFDGKQTVSVITDIGEACIDVRRAVESSDFLILETNYDDQMLEQGPYPHMLKRRIRSTHGHLSNYEAGLCVLEHGSKKLRGVLLAHLSQKNNTPSLAYGTFSAIVRERKDYADLPIGMAYREKPTRLFNI